MLVTMKPTRGNSSPLCHSTLATTRRARSQTPGTIPKVVVSDHWTLRRPPHRPPEQRGDLPLQHLVAGESYSVKDVPLLEVLIDVRLSECGIGTKVPPHSCRPVAGQDRIQYITPPVRAMYVPRTEHRPLAVTELVEHEQRVIARAPKVSVVRRSLLSSMYRTLRTVHVQDHPPVRCVRHATASCIARVAPEPCRLPIQRVWPSNKRHRTT